MPTPQAGPAVVDGLNCAPVTREQIQRTLAGGVNAINLTSVNPWDDFMTSMSDLSRTLAVIARSPDIATIARSVSDIAAAKRDGKLAFILGTQGSTLVEKDLELLRMMQLTGFRILQPTYMERNELGSGVLGKPADDGLTPLGHRWVELMNELRMLIDLSHVGYKTAADVLKASRQPVIFSHANARALCDSLRNVPDELIKAAAKTGGTVGATLWPPMLRHDQRPTIEDWADQVMYMINLVGVDHVAFGSDLSEGRYRNDDHWQQSFGPKGLYPEVTAVLGPWFKFETRITDGYESMANTHRLPEALQRRQLKSDAIDKVMGGNLLRVYEEVWGE
jgi:membrane dipeptidase